MSLQPQVPVRRGWIRRLVIVIVAVALLAGLAVWISGALRGGDGEEPGTTVPSTTPSADPTSPTGEEARVANGCLGGQAVTAQTVLTAQQQAQLDDIGAAEFAATFVRWIGVSDRTLPPLDEVPIVVDSVAAADAASTVLDLEEASARLGAGSERVGPAILTVDGGYYIESTADDEVEVSVLVTVPEFAESGEGTWAAAGLLVLNRSGGEWRVVDVTSARTPDDLGSIMTPFAGGC